ncbi:MAG TPA: hypothetical protein VMX17_05755 [Candidatus Glassbacteria bacterium]|nr:hypothetical protein [Candidatus Glassbacteria bacterium]
MSYLCNNCGHISEAHLDGGECYNLGCSCTALKTDKNIELENLIVRYNGLLEKSDRQREQISMLEQSRADMRLENELMRNALISLGRMMKTKEFPAEAGKLLFDICGRITK